MTGAAAILVVVVVLAWGIVGRISHVADLRVLAEQEAIPKVQLIRPAPGPATRSISLPGTIQAWYAAPIYAQVSGYVQAWYKDYGAPVKRGDVLASIAAPGLDEQYATAKADLAVAQAKLLLAQVTARRWTALARSQAVSQQDVDTQQAAASAQGAQVRAAEHDVARFAALEQFKSVVAPFDGIVTARNTDNGDYVNAAGGDAGARGGSGELFSVSDLHRMRVFVAVPQDYAAMLKPGLTATISLPQYPGRRFDAQFETTSQSFNSATRTVAAELVVDNPDRLIWPGTYTDVAFTMKLDPGILIVPEQALLFGAASIQVAVVDAAGTVHLRPVALGLNLGRAVQVLAGISDSDRLVDNPASGLLDGQTVQVVQGAPGIAPEPQFRVAASTPARSASPGGASSSGEQR